MERYIIKNGYKAKNSDANFKVGDLRASRIHWRRFFRFAYPSLHGFQRAQQFYHLLDDNASCLHITPVHPPAGPGKTSA